MNRTRNMFRVFVCLVFVLAFTLALSSCDKIGGIFNKHEHTYTRVTTPPTCEEQGYTTHTCECGDSYVDGYVPVSHELVVHDAKEPTCTEAGNAEYFTCRKCSYTTYEAINALGHKYEEKVTRFPTTQHNGVLSNICSECGDTHEEEIKAVTVSLPRVAEIIRDFVGMNEVSIDAANTEIIFIEEIEGDGAGKRYIAVDLTRFELSGKEEELYARITFELGIATVTDSEGEPVFTTQMLVDIFANGDEVSIAVTDNGEITENEVNLTEEFYGYIASYFGMTYEELSELYCLAEKLGEYLPIIESLIDWAADLELPDGEDGFNSMTGILYNMLVSVDNDGYYYFDIAGLIDTLETAKTMTVAKLIDHYLGSGTMLKLETFMIALPMTKVKTLAKAVETFAQANNMNLDDVYALINYVIYISTGEDFNLEREIKIRYNKTVAEVFVELSSTDDKEITEAEINAMALGLVTQIKNTIDQLKKYNLDQLYNLYTYEDANFEYSVIGEIVSELELLDNNFSARWHFSEDGELDALTVGILGVLSVGHDVSDGSSASSVVITLEDGKTVTLNATVTESYATVVITSDGYEFVKWNVRYNDDVLIYSEFMLNALYVGALEGYDAEENLLNVITSTFTKGEQDAYEYVFVLNIINSKIDEATSQTVGVYENAIKFTANFDGVNTTVCTYGDKEITIVNTEIEGGNKLNVTEKIADTVTAEYEAVILAEVDEYGMITEATLTVTGTTSDAVVTVTAEYKNESISLVYKLDGEQVAKIVVAIDDDGSIVSECILDGVNVTTEIITYVKEIIEVIENLGVLEELSQSFDLGEFLPSVAA